MILPPYKSSSAQYIGIMISRRFFEKYYRLYSRKKPVVFRGTFFGPAEGFPHLLKRFMTEADSRSAGSDIVLDALAIEICHALIRTIVKRHTTYLTFGSTSTNAVQVG